ncbi:MAG: ClpXP protease specificity-enhancing factor [Burkholderiales bacterium]
MTAEISTKPYLIRAIYEWCVDCGYTPYLSVIVNNACRVPMEHVKNNEIVLNVSPSATRNIKIDNDRVHFSARFNGVSREVSVPIVAVAGIFARENSEGLLFKVEAEAPEPQEPVTETTPKEKSKTTATTRERNHLKVVK